MSPASRESVQTAGETTPDPPESTTGAVEIQGFEEIAQSLNMTVGGIVAHESALKDGELMKIPQYVL